MIPPSWLTCHGPQWVCFQSSSVSPTPAQWCQWWHGGRCTDPQESSMTSGTGSPCAPGQTARSKTGGYMELWLGSVTNYKVKSAYSTQLQTCLSLTLGLVTLSTRCMKPSCCVIWRTDTLNSPYLCPLLVSPVGQYWWHTSCREERSQIYASIISRDTACPSSGRGCPDPFSLLL